MSDQIKININELEKKLKIKFKNEELLTRAFVHRSFLNENNIAKESNERMEFLGDAVLELVITEFLYEKYKKNEGELTAIRSALVKGKNLSEVASTLGLYDCLFLSIGEKKSSDKTRSLILANTMEALIGAIYLDQGYEIAKKFIIQTVATKVEQIIEHKLYIDSKSELQEKTQEKNKITPHYKVTNEEGPDHNKSFTSAVYLADDLIAEGHGASKNTAEQDAAAKALSELFS